MTVAPPASRPPTTNAQKNSMPPSVLGTSMMWLFRPVAPQAKPMAMQMAANSTLNHTTNHTQFHTHLPNFSLAVVQGPTAFMPTAMAKPENGSSAPKSPHSSTCWYTAKPPRMQPTTPMLTSVAPPVKNSMGVPVRANCQNDRIAWAISANIPPIRNAYTMLLGCFIHLPPR